jgi:hypothetical protein
MRISLCSYLLASPCPLHEAEACATRFEVVEKLVPQEAAKVRKFPPGKIHKLPQKVHRSP